jgi:hypothetical protein
LLLGLFQKSESDRQATEQRIRDEKKEAEERRREDARERREEKRLEQERYKEEMKLLRAEMEKKEEKERERSKNESGQMLGLFKLLKDDSGGASKQLMEMTKAQANLMNAASANQFNMATGATKSILDLAGIVKESIGASKGEEKPESMLQTVVGELGKVLRPYAEADANAKQLQGLASQLGISPQDAGTMIQNLKQQGAFGAPSTPAPVLPATPGPVAPPSPAQQMPPRGDPMGALIDRFMGEAPEIVETLMIGMKEQQPVEDHVEMMIEQPATVRTIICTWPHGKIVEALSKHLDTETETALRSDKGKEWWERYRATLKQQINEIRQLDKEEESEIEPSVSQ